MLGAVRAICGVAKRKRKPLSEAFTYTFLPDIATDSYWLRMAAVI
jgi:hypothetical protein